MRLGFSPTGTEPSGVAPTPSAAVIDTRCPGYSLDAVLAEDPPRAPRDHVGAALFELYVGTLYRRGAFPQPGNDAFDGEDQALRRGATTAALAAR